jgi:hypothetical protein
MRLSGFRGIDDLLAEEDWGDGPGLDSPEQKLLVHGVTYYTDELSGIRSQEVWCFLFDPKDSGAQSLELRPCEYQPSVHQLPKPPE